MNELAILERCEPEPNSGCWLWSGCWTSGGYGSMTVKGRGLRSHRWAWELTHGPIPAGMVLLHRCDTPACCNPSHLRVGTHSENVSDKVAKGRHAIGSAQGAARLTESIVADLRQSGESNRALAKRYGVDKSVISRARSGRTWAHVSASTNDCLDAHRSGK